MADRTIDEEIELLRRATEGRRRALRRCVLAVLALAVVLPLWSQHGEVVRAWVRGETTASGEPRFVAPYPVDRRALTMIDFEHVHEELMPTWSIALARANAPWRRRLADDAFDRLADEVMPDPNLTVLLLRSHRALREDPIANAHRLDYWLWAYNHYLDENGIPWRVEASISLRDDGRAIFRTMSYEVLADARNDDGHRLRLLRRADRTSILEGWLGHTARSEEGAMIVMGRVLHFAVRHVWPGLNPALDARRPAPERPWLGYMRDEVRAALGPRTYALLEETAEDQQALIEITELIKLRHECGSQLYVYDLPYNGLSPRSRYAIDLALRRSQSNVDCPEITLDEAASLVGASERLGSTRGLEDALERLAMVVARSVAAHELQHVADGTEPACPGCPEGLSGLALAEVSAYLAAYATEGLGYVALLQACAAPRGDSVHGQASQAVLDLLLPYGCEGPTLHGLYELAGAYEERLFGARADASIPESLPGRVPLLPRRTLVSSRE